MPIPDPDRDDAAQGNAWPKAFLTGLATVALQYALSYWMGGRTGGGGHGRGRR